MKCTPLPRMVWAGTQAGSSSQCFCGTQGTALVGLRAPQHLVLSPIFHSQWVCEPFVLADSLPLHACPAVHNLPTALYPPARQPRSLPTPISSSPYCYNNAHSYPHITWQRQSINLLFMVKTYSNDLFPATDPEDPLPQLFLARAHLFLAKCIEVKVCPCPTW